MPIFGPMFVKEMLETSRRRRYFVLRVSVCAAMLVAFALIVASIPQATPPLEQQSRIGLRLFTAWSVAEFFLATLLTPALVGGLIAAERERGSLDLLFTTHLTSAE